MKKKSTLPKPKDKNIPGSRVSVAVLIDYISEGYSIVEFLADYPWIKRTDAQKALNAIKEKHYPIGHAF